MKEHVIKVSREVWERMRNSVKRIIYDNVEVIDKKEVTKEDDGPTK